MLLLLLLLLLLRWPNLLLYGLLKGAGASAAGSTLTRWRQLG
jgi:hypothetical protein